MLSGEVGRVEKKRKVDSAYKIPLMLSELLKTEAAVNDKAREKRRLDRNVPGTGQRRSREILLLVVAQTLLFTISMSPSQGCSRKQEPLLHLLKLNTLPQG